MQRFITYDASCNFCQGVVRFLKKHDSKKHFVYVPIQSEEGEAIIRKAGLPEKDRNTVVYYTGGRYFLRSTAVLNILRDTHSIWSLAYAGMIFPRPFRDWVYRLVAKYRYHLART
ncbi:MAG: DCC1-like thiol-disulfide oxidoreductase family protein [Bacteroidales bacterium]